jgi:hypothetical protein
MTLSPFPGFFGHQAVITVVRGDVVSVETKKKATSEEAAQMVLMQLILFCFL